MRFNPVLRIVSTALILAVMVPIEGCFHQRVACRPFPNSLKGDSITLISVSQIGATNLTPRGVAHFSVHLEYTLTTYDRAVLSINMIQFTNPESCASSPGEVVRFDDNRNSNSGHISIVRGTHTVDIILTWPGSDGNEVDVAKSGAISIQGSMALIEPPYQFLLRSFGTQFCQRF